MNLLLSTIIHTIIHFIKAQKNDIFRKIFCEQKLFLQQVFICLYKLDDAFKFVTQN